MDCLKMTALISGFFIVMNALSAPAITPQTNADTGRLILFTAGKTDLNTIKNRTGTWEEGDLCPVTETVTHNDEDWIKFSYSGEKGLALSSLRFEEPLLPPVPDGMEFYGISLEINLIANDFAKLDIAVYSHAGGYITRRITLSPGVQTCIIDGGRFTPPKDSPHVGAFDWNQIHTVSLNYRTAANNNAKHAFLLRNIHILQREKRAARNYQPINVAETRPVLEILPAAGAIAEDCDFDAPAWEAAAQITDFHYFRSNEKNSDAPLTAKITYDADNLYIGTEAFFPTQPIANVTRKDGEVWQDEALEYFFCVKNDNRSVTQFAINAIDTVFDYKTYHDDDSGKWRRMMDTGINYKHETSYKNNLFKSMMAFQLDTLDIDPTRTRFIGFQLAQNYHGRDDERLRQLSWSRTRAFPQPGYFGVLVFNQTPFGVGEISTAVIRKARTGERQAEFVFDFQLAGFETGNYNLDIILVDNSFEITKLSSQVNLDRDTSTHSGVFPGIMDGNGLYTLYVVLENEKGDIKVYAVNFMNTIEPKDIFDEIALNPTPKKVVWRENRFAIGTYNNLWLPRAATERTQKTAAIFSRKFKDFTALDLRINAEDDHQSAMPRGIILRISDQATFDGKLTPLQKEGYHLDVSAERIIITGADEPGLFYGGITLFQLMQDSLRRGKGHTVPAVEILDWPDLLNRVVNLEHPYRPHANPYMEERGIEYLMEWVDRFVADNKCNWFFIDAADVIRYQRRPEFDGPEKIYSLDDLVTLAEFCSDRFVSISPRWSCGGHANWWLLKTHPEFREKGWRAQGDVTHPEHFPVLRDCMLDVIEAVNPKIVSPKGDEWWHKRQAGETPDELLRDTPRAQVFLDFQLKLYNWLKEQGIRMTLYEDMLSPFHNGKRYDLYKIVDDLPKDIIITWWKGGHYLDDGLPWFVDKGFTDIWALCTGFYTLSSEQQKHIKGFGKTMYGFHNWLLRDHSNFYYYLPYVIMRTADYAWNMRSDNGQSIEDYVESGEAYLAAGLAATRPNPYAGQSYSPVDITPAANQSLNALARPFNMTGIVLPDELQTIAMIPMLFPSVAGKDCVLLKDDEPTDIDINRKAASLIFLHTAFLDIDRAKDQNIRLPGRRNWPYGYPFGRYIVTYQDGSVTELKLRSGENILPATMGPYFRNTLDHRYTHLVYDENGESLALYQWEWVNPHPEKEIREISVMGEGVFDGNILKTILFAVTCREVANSADESTN